MSVLAEGYSVVIRGDALITKFPGGWDAFEKQHHADPTFIADNEVIRFGFTSRRAARAFIAELEVAGFVFNNDGSPTDIGLVDQNFGVLPKCDWLEVRMFKDLVPVCRLVGGSDDPVFPIDWQYEGSLSESGFVPDPEPGTTRVQIRVAEGENPFEMRSITMPDGSKMWGAGPFEVKR